MAHTMFLLASYISVRCFFVEVYTSLLAPPLWLVCNDVYFDRLRGEMLNDFKYGVWMNKVFIALLLFVPKCLETEMK